jgi:hypothetical protein
MFYNIKKLRSGNKTRYGIFYNTYEKNKSEEIVKPKTFVGKRNSQQQRTYNA